MAQPALRHLAAFAVLASAGCFSESDDEGGASGPDPSGSTSADAGSSSIGSSTTVGTQSGSSDGTTVAEGSSTASTTTSADSTTGDATTDGSSSGGETSGPDLCPDDGAIDCGDGVAVPGEACWDAAQYDNVGDDSLAIVAADFDGDGDDDVAVIDSSDGVRVLWGGGGGLTPGGVLPLPEGTSAWTLDAANLDDDVEAELLVGGFEPVAWLFDYDGASLALTDAMLTAPAASVTARLADGDDDEVPDAFLTGEFSDIPEQQVLRMLPQADLVFGSPTDFPLDLSIADFRVLPVDGNPAPGVALISAGGELLWSPPGGEIASMLLLADDVYTFDQTARLTVGDLDGDGLSDVVVGHDGRAFLYRYDDLLEAPVFDQILGEAVTGAVTTAIGDIDRDGDADLVLARRGDNAVLVYAREGNGYADATPLLIADPAGVAVGHVDGDCVLDLAVMRTQTVGLFLGDP
ncbi:MAG: VCBS repeat-containing protein [Nannocystaceae bacterium]|nr:VCBS repeat-containing protein [Nannocystaceae bacterium]